MTTLMRAAAVGVLLTESQDYDSRGAVPYRVDARGMRTTLFYDLNERLIARLDPLLAYTTYSYDKTARRIAVQSPTTAAGIAITSFGYDLRGLLTTLTFADNSAEVYDHD
ncbi:MAG TPA: hypothetical protein VFJ58_19545, partial [Armatimonadota bacterium]|nr:hypothetical protein [Armatimonadota bacterium]